MSEMKNQVYRQRDLESSLAKVIANKEFNLRWFYEQLDQICVFKNKDGFLNIEEGCYDLLMVVKKVKSDLADAARDPNKQKIKFRFSGLDLLQKILTTNSSIKIWDINDIIDFQIRHNRIIEKCNLHPCFNVIPEEKRESTLDAIITRLENERILEKEPYKKLLALSVTMMGLSGTLGGLALQQNQDQFMVREEIILLGLLAMFTILAVYAFTEIKSRNADVSVAAIWSQYGEDLAAEFPPNCPLPAKA